MGNTDPNNTKKENKYDVKPQYEELSKQLVMQHDIIDAMKCMRAIKDQIARPVYQLAIISIKPLYHAQPISRWKSSVRDHRSPSAHHSSVVDTRIRSNQNFSVAIPTVKNLTPVLLLNKVLASNTKLTTIGISYPTAGTSGRTIGFHCTKKSTASWSYPRSLHSFKWVTIERASHRDSSATKIAQIIGGERRKSAGIKSRSLATGTRRNTQNAAFPLNQMTSLLISDWFFKPNTCHFLDHSQNFAPATSSNLHKRNYCQTQHKTSRSSSLLISKIHQTRATVLLNRVDFCYRSLLLTDFAKFATPASYTSAASNSNT
ncbi:AT-rich interactive domain-containing protein 4-like [Dorcoceras hygrometricum]|uniref:AT-rich interactive domain-containing protein 4-like n=1 Tax=Dorcoceras hygrometricum TaxID=472368 RepID=A0A2Z7DAJ6_9LAMI|nr:AT-rich interactive domain-containing protein 4-like [Dorcoceras hygrometricum]